MSFEKQVLVNFEKLVSSQSTRKKYVLWPEVTAVDTFLNAFSDEILFRKNANLFPNEKRSWTKFDFGESYLRNEKKSNQTKFEFVFSTLKLWGKLGIDELDFSDNSTKDKQPEQVK